MKQWGLALALQGGETHSARLRASYSKAHKLILDFRDETPPHATQNS